MNKINNLIKWGYPRYIQIQEPKTEDDILAVMPYRAEEYYALNIRVDGYVHEVYVIVEARLSEKPSGWKDIAGQLKKAWKDAMQRWEWADTDYAYSHKKY